ncbi:hypothetical protein GUJ93_ZPchr0007g4702 [Zizania palustris]|uniref:HD-Zip IV C-terminal domain-containing protein n=1 Tax=Zizania palustris TaxID=103762 RepID=A0A8J5W5D9_ZIZPA|nr:hypothetical protein GUJ93_ZPchr0007g4702 [Zizania palustris]
MTSRLCRAIGGSRDLAWIRAPKGDGGDDIWLTSRKNAGNDPGEPQGLIACAALSAWLPVNPTALLDLLRNESRRLEWDVLLPAKSVKSCVNLAKGKDRANCVTAYLDRVSDACMPGRATGRGGGGGGERRQVGPPRRLHQPLRIDGRVRGDRRRRAEAGPRRARLERRGRPAVRVRLGHAGRARVQAGRDHDVEEG